MHIRAYLKGRPRASSPNRQTHKSGKKHETNWNLHELRVSSATAMEALFSRECKGRSYLLPFALLVENYDHQLWVFLVAIFSKGQVPALPCHVHHVPESQRRRVGDRSRVGGMGEWMKVKRKIGEKLCEQCVGRSKIFR